MNIYALIPLLSVFAYIGLVVLASRHRLRRERKAFTLYLTAAGFWSLVSLLLRLEHPFLQQQTLLASKVLILALLWMTLTYYHFVRVFVQKPGSRDIFLGSGFVLLVAVLAGLNLVPRAASSSGGVVVIDNGPALYLYALFSGGLVLAAAFHLARYRRQVTTPLARARIAYLLGGLVVVSLGGLTNLHPTLARYPADHLGNLANAAIISYAILRYQLLDITVVVRRGLAYTLLTVGIMAAYLFLLSGAQAVFRGWAGYSSAALAAGLALLVALVFAPLRHLTQERVDRIFFRSTYEYRRILREFQGRLNDVLDLERLAGDLLNSLLQALRARWVALLLPDVESGDFTARFVRGEASLSAPGALRLARTSPLVPYLAERKEVVPVEVLEASPQGKALTEAEREGLRGATLLCPMVSRGNVTGILAVAGKRSGRSYSDEDLDLFLTLASGAAVALDNARMVDDLRRQQRRAEELLAQVVTAQEQERERVAVELHDSVAQWLVRAAYQAQIAGALLARSANGKDLQAELAAMGKTLEESLRELRRVLAGLRPPALDELGLTHALRQAVDTLHSQGIEGQFFAEGPAYRLPPSMEIAVYRIAQEALNNVRRHAQASQVTLRLNFREHAMVIEVVDNGRGFDVGRTLESAIREQHLGLLGMKQRVEWLGGQFTVESKKNAGTRVAVTLPVPAAA